MGHLGWPPSEFWNATIEDLCRAYDGWLEARGYKPPDRPDLEGLDEFLDEMLEKFPNEGDRAT